MMAKTLPRSFRFSPADMQELEKLRARLDARIQIGRIRCSLTDSIIQAVRFYNQYLDRQESDRGRAR